MSNFNLILHTGGQEATVDEVMNVKTPDNTDTWYPISHQLLVTLVYNEMTNLGMKVVNTAHGLWGEGQRYFGLIEVQDQQSFDDHTLVVGLRNSHDKSFPASLVVGAGVFVCDNLSFSGEVKIGRKHTKHIERDLPKLIQLAMARLSSLRNVQEERIGTYKETRMTDAQAHDMIIKLLKRGVISSQRVKPLAEEWQHPSHEEFLPKTAWSFFNDVTEILKPKVRDTQKDNRNLERLPKATQLLHLAIDQFCGLDLKVKTDETAG